VTTWLIVAGDFTPLGGMDAANHGLALYLSARDEVQLVTHRAWPDLERPRVSIDLVARPLGHALGAPMLDHRGRRAWTRLRGTDAHAIVNGGNCAIAGAINWVHYLHAAYEPDVAGSPLRRAKQTVTRAHDLSNERAALTSASLVICNSQRTRRDVLDAYEVDPSRVHVVYYCCDPARLAPVTYVSRRSARTALGWPIDRPVVAFVGALGDRRKSFDTVFAAWTTLCADPTWTADLVVIGTGAEQAAWQERAAAAGLAERIRFLGFRDDVPELLQAVDVSVHPARYEAYGLAVREALCRAIPSIVTASAGVPEEYDGVLRDLLIENPDAADELAGRLRRWSRDRESFAMAVSTLGERLRARTWERMAEDIVSLATVPESVR